MKPDEHHPGEFDQIEIRLFEGRVAKYRVEMRTANDRAVAHLAPIPPQMLESAKTPTEYGQRLSQWLFHDDLLEAFRRVRWTSESYSRSAVGVTGLRLRLWVEPSCTELQTVMWETITDPGRRDPLSLTTAFSRVINAPPRHFRPRGRPLRVLIITASPQGLSRFDLTSIDVDLQRRLVQGAVGLAGQPVDIHRLGPQVTLDDIRYAEKDGFHITHLVAHAMSEKGLGYVLLCDSAGSVQQVTCEEITAAMVPPAAPPSLVYVATPTEGTENDFPTRLGLGRAMLGAGVQAAVVIQAPIEADTLALFTERFYSVLIQTGSVDLAMADARVAIYNPDSWAWSYPVLMLRTDAGELWTPDLDAFETIVRGIRLDRA